MDRVKFSVCLLFKLNLTGFFCTFPSALIYADFFCANPLCFIIFNSGCPKLREDRGSLCIFHEGFKLSEIGGLKGVVCMFNHRGIF